MDATQLLTTQHHEVATLFTRFKRTRDPKVREALFLKIADSLAAHSTIEEKIFYPSAYTGGSRELLPLALEDHLAIKRTIVALLAMGPDEDGFQEKVEQLRALVARHVDEEEGVLFPKVRQNLTPETLEMLGVRMETIFNEIKDDAPRNDVSAQLQAAGQP